MKLLKKNLDINLIVLIKIKILVGCDQDFLFIYVLIYLVDG